MPLGFLNGCAVYCYRAPRFTGRNSSTTKVEVASDGNSRKRENRGANRRFSSRLLLLLLFERIFFFSFKEKMHSSHESNIELERRTATVREKKNVSFHYYLLSSTCILLYPIYNISRELLYNTIHRGQQKWPEKQLEVEDHPDGAHYIKMSAGENSYISKKSCPNHFFWRCIKRKRKAIFLLHFEILRRQRYFINTYT